MYKDNTKQDRFWTWTLRSTNFPEHLAQWWVGFRHEVRKLFFSSQFWGTSEATIVMGRAIIVTSMSVSCRGQYLPSLSVGTIRDIMARMDGVSILCAMQTTVTVEDDDSYWYTKVSAFSSSLCAKFNKDSPSLLDLNATRWCGSKERRQKGTSAAASGGRKEQVEKEDFQLFLR